MLLFNLPIVRGSRLSYFPDIQTLHLAKPPTKKRNQQFSRESLDHCEFANLYSDCVVLVNKYLVSLFSLIKASEHSYINEFTPLHLPSRHHTLTQGQRNTRTQPDRKQNSLWIKVYMSGKVYYSPFTRCRSIRQMVSPSRLPIGNRGIKTMNVIRSQVFEV
jgi:hypothetical protein